MNINRLLKLETRQQVIEAGNSSKPDGIDGSKKKERWIKY